MASNEARRFLARLAGEKSAETTNGTRPPTATDYGGTIQEGRITLDDLDAAADFVADGGLDRLERAVERAESDLSERATVGRETLEAYREFRTVARGTNEPSSASRTTGEDRP